MIGPEDAVATPKEMNIDEINAAIPRSVYLSADGLTPLQVTLGILVLGLIWVAAMSYFDLKNKHEAEALARDGREAIAGITKISHGRGTTYVDYTFPFEDAVY